MLILAILHWGHDLLIRPVESFQYVKDLKRRLNLPDVDFIVWDGHFFCPVRLDDATRQLTEDEVIEFMYGTAYPALEAEGKLIKKNGRYYKPPAGRE